MAFNESLRIALIETADTLRPRRNTGAAPVSNTILATALIGTGAGAAGGPPVRTRGGIGPGRRRGPQKS
jgi:hypothetical protein